MTHLYRTTINDHDIFIASEPNWWPDTIENLMEAAVDAGNLKDATWALSGTAADGTVTYWLTHAEGTDRFTFHPITEEEGD